MIYPELLELSIDELQRRFWGPPVDEDGDDTYFAEVAIVLSDRGTPGLDFLLSAIEPASVPRLRAILFALATQPLPIPTLKATLIAHLSHTDPLVIAEAIDGLSAQKASELTDDVLPFLHHGSPYVTGSVLRFLSRTDPDRAVPYLLSALTDDRYIVRENGVDELDNLGIVEALPSVLPLLDDPHPHVREAAETYVENWGNPSDLAARESDDDP